VGHKEVLTAAITEFRRDPRYQRLLNDAITEDLGIAVDNHRLYRNLNGGCTDLGTDDRHVIVSGFRPNDTVAAHLIIGYFHINLLTTEAPVADRSQPLDRYPLSRYPVSIGAARRLLRWLEFESVIIDRGIVVR